MTITEQVNPVSAVAGGTPPGTQGRAGFPAAVRSTWLTTHDPSPSLTAVNGTTHEQSWRRISTCSALRVPAASGVSETMRWDSLRRYACMMATRRW